MRFNLPSAHMRSKLTPLPGSFGHLFLFNGELRFMRQTTTMQSRLAAARMFAMSRTRSNLLLYCMAIALAVALAACAPHAPRQRTDTPSQEQRLFDLERRMEKLEARPVVEPPYRNQVEIQAQIRELEEERGKLLIRYTPQHPAIKDIDRKLERLNSQLKMLE
jgi:hypothetical protein